MDPSQMPQGDVQPSDGTTAPQPTQPTVTPTQTTATPEPMAAPVAPAAPQVTAPPVAPVMPVAPQPQAHKSRLPLVLALIGGAIGLIIVLALLVLTSFASIQSKAFADSFMTDITHGAVDSALSKTGGDQANKSFIDTATSALKGNSFNLSASSYKSSGPSNYLFTLSGGANKYARVTVDKTSGKYVVTSFVYSPNQLKLVADASSAPAQATATAPSTSACFAPSDYDNAFGWKNTISYSSSSPYITNVHFNSDSLNYDNQSVEMSAINTVAQIVKDNPGKAYSIHLQGSVATTAAADLAFANQRADKVKTDLVNAGVSAADITIDAPSNVSGMAGSSTNSVDQQTSRVVIISFIPGCSTDGSGSTSTSSSTGR